MKLIEIYNQLPKEKLGTRESIVKYEHDFFTINGKNKQGNFILVNGGDAGTGSYVEWALQPETEVEWIGNKPKTNKLYACAINAHSIHSAGGPVKFVAIKVEYRRKLSSVEDSELFIKWLPEGQYPPIEVEGE